MNTKLSPSQREMVSIAAFTAVGNLDSLNFSINKGLDAGLTINQIKEILVQMYAYAGFPRSLQGLNTFMYVLEQRKDKGIQDNAGADASPIVESQDKYTRGRRVLEQLTGTDQTQLTGANAFAPVIDRFLKEHLFADIFGRDVLTYDERELATISALAAMEGVDPMLEAHINMGMNVGLTKEQLIELATIISKDISIDRGNVVNRILEKQMDKNKINHMETNSKKNTLFPLGQRNSEDYFTGETYLQMLVTSDQTEEYFSMGSVTFMPTARTNWHTHPSVQTLVVTEGEGWYQEKGKKAVKITQGSVVPIPAGVEHWHGASMDSKLVHLAITNVKDGEVVTWLSPVTDAEYNSVN